LRGRASLLTRFFQATAFALILREHLDNQFFLNLAAGNNGFWSEQYWFSGSLVSAAAIGYFLALDPCSSPFPPAPSECQEEPGESDGSEYFHE
jgi:hypothetical protein